VPLDIGEEEIKEAAGSNQARRITKHNSLGDKVDTSAVVLSYDCSTEEVPARIHIGFLTFNPCPDNGFLRRLPATEGGG